MIRKISCIASLLILSFCSFASAQEDKALYQTITGKGNIHLNLSVPFINHLSAAAPVWHYDNGGVLGFSVGANYFYADNKFLSVQAGAGIGFNALGETFPDSTGWRGGQSAMALFFNARNNHVWKRFDFGYGITLSEHSVTYINRNDKLNIDSSIRYNNIGIGPNFSTYFRIVYFLYAGVLYQPQVFSLTDGTFKYEHFLSLDVMFRMHVNREKKTEM